MTDEIRAQILNDVREIELMAGEYPRDVPIRYAFTGFASMLRKEFELTDSAKVAIVLDRLKAVQPCPKNSLIEMLDFTRDESRRLISLAVDQALIETFHEATNGRPTIMLRIP